MAHQGYYTNPSNLENINDALAEVKVSKEDADISATNASLSADQARLHETQAEAYASNALASANSASNSKISAANHSQNAQNSKASAAADATLANQYADNSQTYANLASNYRDDALAFRNEAEVFKNQAEDAVTEQVFGPASAVDNEIARFDGTTGKLIKAGLKYQGNRNDTTSGALMVNGAHGLGDSSPPLITDLDARTITSFIREAGATGSPAGGAVTSGIHIGGANADLALQILARLSGDRIWWRRKNITWAAWMELFHSAAACLLTVDTASLGFGTGSGGSVTQATDKTTAVTLNKPTGRITTATSALAAAASATFTLNNSTLTTNDVLGLNLVGSSVAANYRIEVINVSAGTASIRVTNISAGSRSDALALQFVVIKGAIA